MRTKRILRTIVAMLSCTVLLSAGCQNTGESETVDDTWEMNDQNDDTGTEDPMDTENGLRDSHFPPEKDTLGLPSCDAVLVECCDKQTGAHVGHAMCTHDGLQCPSGTTSKGCSSGDTGPPKDTEWMSDDDADTAPATPCGDGATCCDENTGVKTGHATCTDSGWKCPSGSTQQACKDQTHDTSFGGW